MPAVSGVYQVSFLEHLSRDTGGHTGSVLHFKLTCLNHLADVELTLPEVKQLDRFICPTRISNKPPPPPPSSPPPPPPPRDLLNTRRQVLICRLPYKWRSQPVRLGSLAR